MQRGKKCEFKTTYFDYKYNAILPFECFEQLDDDDLQNNLCFFHDKTYLECEEEKKRIRINKILTRLRDILELNYLDNIVLVEYIFPPINFNFKVSKPVYYVRCKFMESNFTSIFSSDIHFYNCKFSEDISFSNCEFKSNAIFYYCEFLQSAIFTNVQFWNSAIFIGISFTGKTIFESTTIIGNAHFNRSEFKDKFSIGLLGITPPLYTIFFDNCLFVDQEKVSIELEYASNFSFINTDITRIKFNENIIWGTSTRGKYKIINEEELSQSLNYEFDWNKLKDQKESIKLAEYLRKIGIYIGPGNFILEPRKSLKIDENTEIKYYDIFLKETKKKKKIGDIEFVANSLNISLYSFKYNFIAQYKKNRFIFFRQSCNLNNIKAIYRNLRENYEYRMKYEDAGQFFIREMEIKRIYREIEGGYRNRIIKNNWFRQNVSLTGIYYNLAKYGEDLYRPSLLGVAIIVSSTIFFSLYSNASQSQLFLSDYEGFNQLLNVTNTIKAFERSYADFIPFLPILPEKAVFVDYLIKSLGSVLSIGFLAIALRRRFERRFRH